MKHLKLLLLSLTIILLYKCDDLSDLNIDPNSAVEVDPSSLLTNAQYNFYNRNAGTNINADWGLLMVQYWAQNEYTEDSRYSQTVTTFDFSWEVYYADVLKELYSAKELVELQDVSEGIKTNRKNILDVMIAQTYALITDGFGDIPYTEAISTITLPKYDTQEDIYKGILATLQNAANTFSTSSISFETGDVIFNGNIESWIKFTNSLIIRYAMRISDVDLTTAQSYIQSASSNLMTSNADNAQFIFDSNPDRANPLYINYSPLLDNRDDYCVSEYLVNTLNDLGDPRLDVFAQPTSLGTIVGMPYGLSDNDATLLKPTTSRPNDAVREATTPHVIMSYSEIQFLLSEAYQRGILSGDAATSYANAIEASMNQWSITDATAISNYITSNPYDSSNWKESIGTQKWISFYMNGFEAWNEWRRLDYPVLDVPAAALITSIPVKLPYPLSETQNNSSELSKVSSTPSDMTVKVWWDVN